jgi:hypothetical protein
VGLLPSNSTACSPVGCHWHQDFVIACHNGQNKEKHGTLGFLSQVWRIRYSVSRSRASASSWVGLLAQSTAALIRVPANAKAQQRRPR